MFPCEMARYIAGFSPEARKSGVSRSRPRSDPEVEVQPGRFSISDCSAGISWPQRALRVSAAELAAVEAAVPGGRPGPPDAAAEAVGRLEEVGAPALLSALPDVAAAGVA